MRRLSIIAALLGVVMATTPALARAETTEAAGGNLTLVMFGASWCAPCIAEVRSLAQLSTAAADGRILVAWTDGGFTRLRIALPANVDLASPERANRLWAAHGQAAAGLPFSVMLDDMGRRCAQWSHPLKPETVGVLRRACLKT